MMTFRRLNESPSLQIAEDAGGVAAIIISQGSFRICVPMNNKASQTGRAQHDCMIDDVFPLQRLGK